MSGIVPLVEAAFVAKRTHGPTSKEFKEAQASVLSLIDKTYDSGAKDEIPAKESKVLGLVKIVVEKKGKGADSCSFVLAK